MSDHKRKFLKSSSGVALATMLSRALGLIREMLLARIIGGGVLMTAWGLAFMVPNLFRRLLGEGATGTALVPMIRHCLEKDGEKAAKEQFTVVFYALGLILAVICVVLAGGAYFLEPYCSVPRIKLTLLILPIVAPYALFICLVGVMCSLLNSLGRFFLPALMALLLNICLILCLSLVCPRIDTDLGLLRALSYAVLLAGVLQFLFILVLVAKAGFLPVARISHNDSIRALRELWRLALPGMLGASVLQISFLIDRSLACYLGNRAVPALIFSDRIIYLPIGVFAVALGSVALSSMSQAAAKSDFHVLFDTLNFSLRQLLFICVPISVFTILFGEDIIRLLFGGGKFGAKEISETYLALRFYALGIPAFAAIKITISAFYARKDMKNPVRIAIICVILNTILNLILMWPLRQGGIALATVISSLTNNFLLLQLLKKQFPELKCEFTVTLIKSLLAAGIAGFALIWFEKIIRPYFAFSSLISQALFLLSVGALFCFIYFIIAKLTGLRELGEFLDSLKKRRKGA